MDGQGAPGSDRRLILATVAAADRRLGTARCLREIVRGSTVVLYATLAYLAIAHVLPVAQLPALLVASAALVLLVVWRTWVFTRRRMREAAASVLDTAAGLGDELVSAHWFAGRETASPWEAFHLRQAAQAIAPLDIVRLLPVAPPRRAVGVLAGVLVACVAVGLVPAERTRSWARGGAALTEAERAELTQIARVLSRDPARAEIRARIDELLRRLHQGDLSPEQTLAIVDELRELLAVASTGSGDDLRDALVRAGDALAADALAARAGEAMRQQQLDAAARRMRELAAVIDQAMQGGASARDLQAALDRASALAQSGFTQLATDLADAARELGDQQADEARASLERAADDLETAAGMQEFEQAIHTANRQLDDLRQSLGSRFGPAREGAEAARRDEQQPLASSDQTPSGSTPRPESGPGRPTPGNRGEQAPTMIAASNEPGSSAPGMPGTPSIAAAGPQARLDVTRRREILPVEAPPDVAKPPRMIDEETRAMRATVPYRPVAVTPPYADADRLTPDEVPAPYRDLVKSYFRLLGPRGARER